MLKIKKTKPYQFRKLRNRSAGYKFYASRMLCAAALICGIVSSLALLSNYTEPVNAASLTLSGITTMQEMTPYICDNSTIGETNPLTDMRDGKSYTVRKLVDGRCWMTDSLQLTKESLVANGQPAKLDSATSNVAENSTFEMPDTIQTLSSEDSVDFSDEIDYNNTAQVYNPGTAAEDWQEGYGAYYNWYAATAGVGNAEFISGNAPSDICPKGWRLPTGGPNGEFEKLYNFYPNTAWTELNGSGGYWLGASDAETGGNFFSVNGAVYNGKFQETAGVGRYWSSNTMNSRGAYYFYFHSAEIHPIYSSYRYGGVAVRCIAEGWPSKDVNVVAVRVSPVISIDATSGMKEEVDPNKVTTGTISATVSANTAYSVQLSASKTSLTNSVLGVDTEITSSNSIPASTNVQAKTNAWGILNQDNSTYSAITSNPTTYYNTEEYNDTEQSTKHTFNIGVSISPTLPAGEYSTTVTITAVNN